MNRMASTSNCVECCMHAANPFQVQEIALTKKQMQQKKDPSIFGKCVPYNLFTRNLKNFD